MAKPASRRPRAALLRPERRRGLRGLRARLRRGWVRLLERRWPWLLLLLLVGGWAIVPPGALFAPTAAEGEVATRDFVAPRTLLLLDEESTRDKREREREQVPPVYDLDPFVATELEQRIAMLFAEGRRLTAGGRHLEAAEVSRLRAASALTVSDEQLATLARHAFAGEMAERLAALGSLALRRGVVDNKAVLLESRGRGIAVRNLRTGQEHVELDLYGHLGYPEEVRDLLTAEMADWSALTPAERGELVDFLLDNLTPNLQLDRAETEKRRQAAADTAGPVYNRLLKGQVIVRKGDQVDAAAARQIAAVAGEQRGRQRLLVALGSVLLLALAALLLAVGLRPERVRGGGRRLYGEALLLLLVSLLGVRFGFVVAYALAGAFDSPPLTSGQSFGYALPFAAFSFLAALIWGRGTALLLGVVFSLLVGRLAGGDGLEMAIYALGGSLAAVFALERMAFKERSVVTRIGLVVGVVNAVVIVLLAALAGTAGPSPMQLGFDVLCGLAGGLLVTAVVSFAVPILESVLSVTTDIQLLELANTNLPLLRRLAIVAPGTFQHSLMVATLCKAGCEEIGADPVLAYTCALYHDVGKVSRPEYFVENQRPGHNPHDKLLPSMSALVLVNHIKDGLQLAEEYHLPQPVRDAVEQHHGTRLMRYFYNRALEQATSGGASPAPPDASFRYPGPKPQDKVMGVLMLADAVEAASRTLSEPTPPKVRAMIRAILEDCLRDGQLDETDLTLGDLKAVGEAFLQVLATLYHRRIDYPGFDFNAAPARERPTLRPAAEAR